MAEIRIATAASQAYANSVVALAASIRANWSRGVKLLEHVARKRSGPYVFKFPAPKKRSAVWQIGRQCARALRAPVTQWVGQCRREQNEGIYDGVRD